MDVQPPEEKKEAKQESPPAQIEIRGMEKSIEAILDDFVGNWEFKQANRTLFRQKWMEFLPQEIRDGKKIEVIHKPWSMAYVPRISMRKAYSNEDPGKKFSNLPYFIFVLNSARDERPQKPVPEGVDVLQSNILDKGMTIASAGKFWLTPNGFPYHKYASLLISKEARSQKAVSPEDIIDWMKFAFLTNQNVFFNSQGAGASRPERFHAQVVDPEVLHYEGKTLEYPIRDERVVKTVPVKNGIHELRNYPVESLIFVGRDAPHQASRLVMKFEGLGIAYNIATNGKEVYVIGRNRTRERSDCIGKKVGCYECMGVVLIGNVEEPLMDKLRLDRVIHGEEVFSELTYEIACSNLGAASMPTNWMKDLL